VLPSVSNNEIIDMTYVKNGMRHKTFENLIKYLILFCNISISNNKLFFVSLF